MKKIKYIILVLCLMFIPVLNISAEENVEEIDKFNVVAGDDITSSSKVDGSSIISGNNVTTENTIKGIDMVFGNNVAYNSNSDYSVVAGNTVNVSGITNNDAFIFGNAIIFSKEYKASRDLFVFGNSVTLKGEITRDVTIYASSVILEDVTIKGNVTINAATINVKSATVEGTLSYNEDSEITISEEAIINAKNTFIGNSKNQSVQDVILNHIIDYASMLFTFLVLALTLPFIFKKIENKTEDVSVSNVLSMLGYGLFLLIIIPVMFILLATTTIGAPLSMLLIALYLIVIFLSTTFTGYFIGLMIWKKFIKKEINVLLVGLIGISIIKVLSLIPYVGVIITLINILLSLSIFMKLFTKDA